VRRADVTGNIIKRRHRTCRSAEESSMVVLSLFDGMSCGQIACERAGIKVDKYYASEIDKYAIQVTQKNYPDTIQLGDITKWKEWDIEKPDIILAGSPCQGFSFAGKQLNFEDERSKLFFVFMDILKYYKPKYFLLENVNMKKEYQDIISKAIGVQPIKINSKYFTPQNRLRLFWTNIKVENIPTTYNHCLNDILEKASDKYYLTKKQKSVLDLNYKWCENEIIRHKAGKHQQDNIYRYDGLMACLSASHHGAARHLTKTYLPNGEIRRLTENEVEKLQGVPIDYTKIVSSSKRYEVLGNGWTVDVISHILKSAQDVRQ
jgi:DNA-cytosine methyltransferase